MQTEQQIKFANNDKGSIMPLLHEVTNNTQNRIDRRKEQENFIASQVKSHADVSDIKSGKMYIPINPVTVPVFRKVRNAKKRPTDLISWYDSKTAYSKKAKKPETKEEYLVSLAIADATIKVLSMAGIDPKEYNATSDADKAVGIDFVHVSESVKYCHAALSSCMTDLSKKWGAKKRPQEDFGMSVLYKDGKEVNTLDLLSDNHNPDSQFHKHVLKTLKGDAVKVYDYYIQGFSLVEIAVKIEKSIITVKRIKKVIDTALAPIASDLAEEIRRQETLPAFAW